MASASAQGIVDAEFARALSSDLADFGFDPGVREMLIALRQRDVMAFVVAFANARDAAAARRPMEAQSS